MKDLRLIPSLTKHAWKSICQQFWLLAVLSMLFFLLCTAAGPVAGELLDQGVDFTGLTFGVCAPEGDSTAQLLETLTARMKDVSQYATFRSMGPEEAASALEAGELSAVLMLPQDFVGGILGGSNPDVTLIVSREKPLEALLTYWIGQSAADLLSASQRGIYAVLDIWPAEGWDQAMADINLRYISIALNRQDIFKTRELAAVESMDLATHYALSLLIFLIMALPPVLRPLFEDADAPFRRRLLSLGHGAVSQYFCCFSVAFCILLLMAAVPVLLCGWDLLGAVLLALFGAAFSGVCCLLTRSTAGCGGIAFPGAAAAVFLSGGILPTPLLPDALRRIGSLSPATSLRTLLHQPTLEALLMALLWTAILSALGIWLYSLRLRKGAQ